MPSSVASDRRHDRGQATIELALCLPLVCLVLLGVVQVAVVVRDQLLAQHAAREAARAASVSASPDAAAARAVGAIDGDVRVAVRSSARTVTATVTITTRTDVPLVGALLPDITQTATATMAREPP